MIGELKDFGNLNEWLMEILYNNVINLYVKFLQLCKVISIM